MANKKMCCVMGCPSTQGRPREPLYVYPRNTTERYKRWLTLFPNSFVLRTEQDNYICRRHFTVESFDEKLRLKHSADPTINIDTSYAQDQILKTFLTKILYEWSLRSDISDVDSIIEKALEAKNLLGISSFKIDRPWISNFLQIRQSNVQNGVRFGSNTTGKWEIYGIIKDLRHYLPSNFILPVDVMEFSSTGDVIRVKNEFVSDGDADEADSFEESDNSSQGYDSVKEVVAEKSVTIEPVPGGDLANKPVSKGFVKLKPPSIEEPKQRRAAAAKAVTGKAIAVETMKNRAATVEVVAGISVTVGAATEGTVIVDSVKEEAIIVEAVTRETAAVEAMTVDDETAEAVMEPAPVEVITEEEASSNRSLDTYQDAFDILKPMAAYISRIGNLKALTRLREIETVVKSSIYSEQRNKKRLKRYR